MKGKQDAAERALSIHQHKCPAAVSVKRGIDVSWSVEIEEE
ncbi:MAG: hypothetical protein ACE5JB_09820 [bacterium]